MAIRAKWVRMPDKEKCRYNGYHDFFKKESERVNREERQAEQEKKEIFPKKRI